MCGIVGYIGGASRSRDVPSLGVAALGHRGPGGRGLSALEQGRGQFGHARLSIIDPGGGAQPMRDIDGLALIVFNGEIYNHASLKEELNTAGRRFATRSDTEVVLQAYLAWGLPGLARLRGMYALALHDRRAGRTIVVRDPFGIKPLFYAQGGEGFAFASEIGALVAILGQSSALEIDATSVLETLVLRYPIGEHTLYRGIRCLEPGSALVLNPAGRLERRERIVSLSDEVERHRRERLGEVGGRTDLAADTRARVADAVEKHTVADVPVGCFLSGGLDSSVIARLLSGRDKGLDAYAVGFQGTASEASELPFAREVATAFGVRLHEVELGPADFVALAPCLSGTLNGPFSEPADIAMLKLSRVAACDLKVVLSGEGGDESFAGYPKYAVDRLAPGLGVVARAARLTLGRQSRLGIAADALAEPDPARRWLRWFANDAMPIELVRALGGGTAQERAVAWVQARLSRYPRSWTDLQRMQVLDLESWLTNNLLHRGDYTTMQASLEQRVPLLDLELTPWAVALPDTVKLRGLRGKAVLRDAFGELPRRVLRRAKSGFRLPLGEWLASDRSLRAFAADHLLAPSACVRQWLGRAELEGLLGSSALSGAGGARRAWTVLNLELWLGAQARREAGA